MKLLNLNFSVSLSSSSELPLELEEPDRRLCFLLCFLCCWRERRLAREANAACTVP